MRCRSFPRPRIFPGYGSEDRKEIAIFNYYIFFPFVYLFFPCKRTAAPLGEVIPHGRLPSSVRPGGDFRCRFWVCCFFWSFVLAELNPGCSAPIPRNVTRPHSAQPSSAGRPRSVPTAIPGPAFREPSGAVGDRLCRRGTETSIEK